MAKKWRGSSWNTVLTKIQEIGLKTTQGHTRLHFDNISTKCAAVKCSVDRISIEATFPRRENATGVSACSSRSSDPNRWKHWLNLRARPVRSLVSFVPDYVPSNMNRARFHFMWLCPMRSITSYRLELDPALMQRRRRVNSYIHSLICHNRVSNLFAKLRRRAPSQVFFKVWTRCPHRHF